MIYFYSPKFHENIMKKYGKIVRKSYFPDLFFKQDIKSSVRGKSHVSIHIKFDFYTITCKNFPLSFLKEKQHTSSFFPLELNNFSSKSYEHTNEKSACFNVELVKRKYQNFLGRLISFELPPHNFRFSGQVTPDFALFKLEHITPINKILTAYNIQLSNLITLDPAILEKNINFLYQEYSANPESNRVGLRIINGKKADKFRFSKQEKIKLLSAGKLFSVKKKIAGKKTPERLSKNRLTFKKIFLQGDLPGFPELYSRQALGLFYLIGSPLSSVKNENLNAAVESHESASRLADNKNKRYPGYNRSEKIFTTYLTDAFQQQYPEANNEIRAVVYGRILISPIEQQTKNLLSVLKLNSLCNLEIKSSGHTVTRVFNRLTAFIKNTITVSKFHSRVSYTSGSTKLFKLNKQETHKPDSHISSSYFDAVIMQANRTLISVFKSLGVLLTGNKRTHITKTNSTDSSENIIQENDYHYLHILLQKAFEFPKVSISLSTATIKDGNAAHSRKIPVILEYNNIATHIPEQQVIQVPCLIGGRIFTKLMTLKPVMIKDYSFNHKTIFSSGTEKVYSHLYFASMPLSYARISTFSKILRSFKVLKTASKVASLTDFSRAGYHLSGPYDAENYIAEKQHVDNIRELRELKKIRHYFIARSKLQSTISQPVFPKSPETNTYGSRRGEALLYSSKQSSIFNKTTAPISVLHESHTYSSQTPPLYFTSNYTGVHSAVGEFNYPATNAQNYPEVPFYYERFSPLNYFVNQLLNLKMETINYLTINGNIQKKIRYFSEILNNNFLEKRNNLALSSLLLLPMGTGTFMSLLKKHMLEHLKITFSLSDFTILSKVQKLIMGDKLSANGLLSNKSFYPSLTFVSETDGTAFEKEVIPLLGIPLFDLSKYASARISQNPVFARKSGVRVRTESGSLNKGRLEHKMTSVLHFNEKQKLIGKEIHSRKTARISLCCGEGKKENSNMRTILLRSSLNSPEKSNQQVNNMITSAELRTLQKFFFGSGFSSKLDFALKIKWKNLISTFTPGKKKEKRKDMPGRALFEFKRFLKSNKTAKSHLLEPQNTYLAFMKGGTDKTFSVNTSGTFRIESSDLIHAEGSMHKSVREDLVYGTPQNLLDEVKRIEKIAFEAKEAVADHFESHSQQENRKTGQIMDIEHISEKVIQIINHRLKIEVERRGIF